VRGQVEVRRHLHQAVGQLALSVLFLLLVVVSVDLQFGCVEGRAEEPRVGVAGQELAQVLETQEEVARRVLVAEVALAQG